MIDEWVLEATKTTAVVADRLPQETVETLLRIIKDRYVEGEHDDLHLWERFHNDISRRRADGWSLICDFATDRPILLFCENKCFIGYRFMSGEDLRAVLKDCPGFEFYVTTANVDFVLCHNHHDYLIGVGMCEAWISTLDDQGNSHTI